MRTSQEGRAALLSVVKHLRELIAGLVMPTRGGCVCDPVAWERDTRRRIDERDAANLRRAPVLADPGSRGSARTRD